MSRIQKFRDAIRSLLDEPALGASLGWSRLQRFVHFWMLVWTSFNRNRCPVRASALAYATLLALIPMLAVAVSVTSSFLKKEGEDRIDQFISRLVDTLTPPGSVDTNAPSGGAPSQQATASSPGDAAANVAPYTGETAGGLRSLAQDERAVAARKEVARSINQFIQNTRSGALGVTGSILLIFAAISMLSRIEVTFNDIWGVERGRSWFIRIVLYWGVLTLAPLLLIVALGLATGPHWESTRHLLATMPLVGEFLFRIVPFAVVCLTFALFYMLMPNTKVLWRAALVGGLVGGLLFHLNNAVSVLYVSRVVSNSKIYGSVGLVPVFMIGLYFSWLILLFGAQVAYAFQNRAAYLEEKQVETLSQNGREFIALRLMTRIAQRFEWSQPPVGVAELASELGVPTRLVRQILQSLATARLVVETSQTESAYLPARPLDRITCHDILTALRTGRGAELTTRPEPDRSEVLSEFQRIQAVERQAAASVTLLALVNRLPASAGLVPQRPPRALSHPTSA